MARQTIRDWIRSVERAEPTDQWTMLCFFAGRGVMVVQNLAVQHNRPDTGGITLVFGFQDR